jgi:hypothetical protein
VKATEEKSGKEKSGKEKSPLDEMRSVEKKRIQTNKNTPIFGEARPFICMRAAYVGAKKNIRFRKRSETNGVGMENREEE